MQQNAYGAQYDAQNAQAEAQEKQAKVAFEQARVTETNARAEKERLQGVVAGAQIETDSKSKEVLAKLFSGGTLTGKPQSEQAAAIAGALMPVDPEKASRVLSSLATFEYKEAQAKAKDLETSRDSVVKASSVLDAVPADRVEETFNNLPEASRKSIVDQVGPANWSQMSAPEKKAVVHNLMESGNIKLKQEQLAAQERIAKIKADAGVREAEIRAQASIIAKQAKSETALKAWSTAQSALSKLDHNPEFTVELKEAEEKEAVARENATKPALWSYQSEDGKSKYYSESTFKEWQKSLTYLNNLKAKHLEEKRKIVKSLPEIDGGLRKSLLETFDLQDTPPPEPKPKEPVAAPKGAASAALMDKSGKPIGGTSSKQPQLSGPDKEALDWANKNPGDSRAARIKQRLGM
jgi:hypothetical protein